MGVLEKGDMRRHIYRNVWESYTNSDLTEGRGAHVHIGYFLSKKDAERAGVGQGVMGTDARVRQVGEVSLIVYETFDEFLAIQKEEKRQQALAKLTQEERELLGL